MLILILLLLSLLLLLAQIHSLVDIDVPLFQPSPKIVVFEDYAPFAVHEKKLFFRNNDGVARRIKLLQPESTFFEISAPRQANGEPLKQSKIAAGMEICFVIKFKPQEVRDYQYDLVCSTEREKFIVPIRAIGMRPMMTFPDEINFGVCPVKSETRKSLLLQNIGSSIARFTLRSTNPSFTCPGEEQIVDPGASLMLELFFIPNIAESITGDYELQFSKGIKCYISLSGTGKNIDVALSTPSISLEPSYISLSSQKTLKIKNSSDIPIKYSWKSFSSSEDEENERQRLLQEISRMESIEKTALKDRIFNGVYSVEGYGDTDDEAEDDEIPFAARADEASLIRKYRNLRTALSNDPMYFVDDIFEVSPIEGQVWANSEMEVTVTFRPDTAALFNCIAYLDISGRSDRLLLNCSGQGIGPHAALSFDVLDVGDVFINDEQHYEISMINKGDITANWTFMSSLTRFGNKFNFSPTEGILNPGQSQVIHIKFESDVLGEFSEYFRFALQGNEDMLVCQIKGHIVGPTFCFDINSINFGTVSYDYLHSRTLRLVNTSKISMVFNLHVPQDGTFIKKEFDITPSDGTLTPGESMDILLEFIPSTVKVYDYSLAVDVLGVGDILLSIPISAECIVSTVRMATREIDFGDCFLRFPYEKEMILYNVSDKVHTKFEVLPQMPYTKAVATYEAEPSVGVIEPGDSMKVIIRMVTMKLNLIKLPINVAVVGSTEAPIQAVLTCNAIGPRIVPDQTELRWGNIECLREFPRTLRLFNDSLIPASVKLFLKMARSKFDISMRELSLAPKETFDLIVTANLDDTIVNKDEIHIIVEEGDNVMVPLSALGIGTTIHCNQELSVIDMGYQLTNTTWEKRIMLENKGRRPQQLQFYNKTEREQNLFRLEQAKKMSKDATKAPKSFASFVPVCTVTPAEITLRPRTATTFTFKGTSAVPGPVSEMFILESKVGKDRAFKQIAQTEIKCEIINPLLEFSDPQVYFCHRYEKGHDPETQRRDITLKNTSALTLTFVLKVEIPFNLNSWEHTLAPGQVAEVTIDFDPMYLDDKTSHTVEKQLVIAYRGHPQKDIIPLTGEIIFPNLKFETQNVAFGSILNDTTKTIKVNATNWSQVVVEYEWTFFEGIDSKQPLKGLQKKGAKSSGSSIVAPAGQIFDILPIRSVLQPGESETLEFSMYGLPNGKFNGTALCSVEGGPEYKFYISGEASTVSFAVDKSLIDFGKVIFTESKTEELKIINNGRVAFNYDIKPSSTAAELIEIIPPSGLVKAGETKTISLVMHPAYACNIAETVFIHIAHFDAVPLVCYCQGIFPSAVASLPRQTRVGPYGETEGTMSKFWDTFTSQAVMSLVSPDLAMLPPPEDMLPPPASGTTATAPIYHPPPIPNNILNNTSVELSTRVTKQPPQLKLEVEMQRMVLCHLLANKVEEKKIELGGMVQNPDQLVFAGLQYFISKNIDLRSIVSAQHLCDFGNVIIGQTKKRTFKITNVTNGMVLNFDLDSKAISSSGFSVDPEKVVKLGENDSVDFTLKYFARKQQKLGRKTVVLPLLIKGAPTINLLLSANVCMPDIELSSELIEFDRVLIGRAKRCFVRLHNISPVVANWSFKPVAGKEESKITIVPSSGVLKGGRKTIIYVEFIPGEARKYLMEANLKVDNNKNVKVLKIVGEGFENQIKFEPSHLEMGPIIPFSDGDEQVVSLTNNSDVPVEIFSLDFDNVYKEEEAMLSSLDIYDGATNIFRSSIRYPGQPLPPEILAAYDRIKAAADKMAAEEAAAAAAVASEEVVEGEGDKVVDTEIEKEESAKDNVILEVPPVRTTGAPRDEGLHQDIIVVGPPISGVTTVANYLSRKLQLPVKKLDDIMFEVASTDSELGLVARRCLNKLTEAERATIEKSENELLEVAEKSKADAADAFRKDKKNKGKEPDEECLNTPEVIAYNEFVKTGKFSIENLSNIIKFRLSWIDAGYGIVLDGVISNCIDDTSLVVKAMESAMPKASVSNIVLNGGEEAYTNKIAAIYETKSAELKSCLKDIDNAKKAASKKASVKATGKPTGKGKNKKPSTATIIEETTIIDHEIEVALPEGDEPWVNTETGLVIELDAQDFKNLEESEKVIYTKQFQYQLTQKVQSLKVTLAKIKRIWDPETGLKQTLEPIVAEIIVSDDNLPVEESKTDVVDTPAFEATSDFPVEETKAIETNNSNTPDSTGTLMQQDEIPVTISERPVLFNEYANSILPLIESSWIKPEPVAIETEAGDISSEPVATEANPIINESESEPIVEEIKPKIEIYGVINIPLDGEENEEEILAKTMALLPPPNVLPADKDALPPTCVYQVIRKPVPRGERKQIRNFAIIRMDPSSEESVQESAPAPAPAPAPAGKKGAPVVEAPPVVKEPEPVPVSYRWVIDAFSSVQLKVKFTSKNEGKFDSTLVFEVVGTSQTFSLYVSGICEVPKINDTSRSFFVKSIKNVSSEGPPPIKRFITSTNTYSFGPILTFKKPEWRNITSEDPEERTKLQLVTNTSTDIVRLSNNGRYKCTVDLAFEDYSDEVRDVFIVEPNSVELDEGETKDVKIWAFPQSVKEFKNTLVACVSNNPIPIKYDMKCWGVEPTIDVIGPWDEALKAAEQAVNECQDKKLIKDLEAKLASLKEALTLDFDRILINKVENRTFEIKNTCLLPVTWEIDAGDFNESPNIKITPMSGEVKVGSTQVIRIEFTSPEPKMLSGKFSLKFSDAEGGLQTNTRVSVRKFAAVAEAYQITTVSLTSTGSEEGGSEIDFGLVRVGDFAKQSMKLANKGKYKIAYKVNIVKPAIANLIKIEPMEGFIEAGAAPAEIVATFCSANGEVQLKQNKDVKIEISEPLTGESVAIFPLYVNAEARFNRYRMQPAKGVSFGAVRFDAEAKTKRVEIRNEGKFDFTFVVCAAQSEIDEIDSLDPKAFACYAYGTPAALRKNELGENYLEKVGGAGAGGKDAKAAPAKGKGAPAAATPSSTSNPLVQDPDSLAEAAVPDDPLVVGAFTILGRVGVVQPGATGFFDMKFDPSGSQGTKEKLRICITGIDHHDAPAQLLRSFEVTGESCIPAITNEDYESIFEEQEVVSSLLDSGMSDGGKIEKLPVGKVIYAEKENILAFGPVLCGQQGYKGACERIRITNPTKIDAKVRFEIMTPEKAAEAKGASASAGAGAGKDAKGKAPPPAKGGAPSSDAVPQMFTVQPEVWEIPPHEHRFVNVYFNPLEIKTYKAVFVAKVEDAGTQTSASSKISQSGSSLIFDLGGSGTLPCISIDQPTTRLPSGALSMEFGRTHINRSSKKKLIIRNDGAMPATCLFDMSGDDDFFFPYRGASLTIQPSQKQDVIISFAPKKVFTPTGERSAQIKISVLNNQFDQYKLQLSGSSYACDATIDTMSEEDSNTADNDGEDTDKQKSHDEVKFADINLANGSSSTSHTIMIKSQSAYPLKFELVAGEKSSKYLTFSPCIGHLGPKGTREITMSFNASEPVKLEAAEVSCILKRIDYKLNPKLAVEGEDIEPDSSLWGLWDDSMKSLRPAADEDLKLIAEAAEALEKYNAEAAAEAAKGKKGKVMGPPPDPCRLQLVTTDGSQMINEIIEEPYSELVADAEVQKVNFSCYGSADIAKYSCEGNGENIPFRPTYLFQSALHNFTFKNDSDISLPIKWSFDDVKRRGVTTKGGGQSRLPSRMGTAVTNQTKVPCPFFIEPEECEVPAKGSQQFTLKFLPLECDDFVYALRGETLPCPNPDAADEESAFLGPIRMIIRGTAKRPLCHFEIKENPEYLSRRLPTLKNEIGLVSPIENGDLRVVEMESVGLRTRNTFRFHIINPTSNNYEFTWETMGDPSPFWRCVLTSGMLFAGKRIEMVFEYLPEETSIAESFFKFKLPTAGVEQLFLFAGKVTEPKVYFSTSRVDFHSVMLGGQGSSDVVYLENQEHLPFNFSFDRTTLMQLEGPNGPVLDIQPKSGTVGPQGKFPITFLFKPSEEVVYNFNLQCEVKRKPNKLSINVKGEGYAVHPIISLEQSEEQAVSGNRFQTLKPVPAVNYADFGAVQVLDSITKKFTVTNNGKYNFDYLWDTESGNNLTLSGGKMGGTLHKGEEVSYNITFAPMKECSLDGSMLSFTVAGKYTYNIFGRGSGVSPALRFSFMQYDFGSCFITSPGGQTVIEETTLRLVNHDPVSNISIESAFQKTRALWVDCPPTVLEPGSFIDIPIKFAPRDAKDYLFIVPIVVNGTTKVPVNITGKGINARLEMVNASQRRINFGVINVGSENRKTIALINRSKRALPVQLADNSQHGSGILEDLSVAFYPKNEFTIGPRETVNIQLIFAPNKRISQFQEDLLIRYAGVTRKLLSMSGKAQGIEVAFDSDSLPFGPVVLASQKMKKLSLENGGDLAITFQWLESTFGPHFSISPLSGKIGAGDEMTFDVIFKPQFLDEDIRQEGILCAIPGISPLQLTCSGTCIAQPSESMQTLRFDSLARKPEVKNVKIDNPTEKDWYVSPSLLGKDWKIPYELKVPAKGSADLVITYFPLSMSPAPKTEPAEGEPDTAHQGTVFVSLPDGTARSYKLRGYAGPPECAGTITIETAAKKASTTSVKLNNWLGQTQKLLVSSELTEKACPATFIIAANAVEIGPNGTKEFPIRYNSYMEGTSKGVITFTNASTGEYLFYNLVAKTTMADVLETINIESPVRQSARYVITVENPLPVDTVVSMGSIAKPDEWWSCDSKVINFKELSPLSGNPEGSFEIEYRPLMPTKAPTEHLLTIITKELGTFKYKVVLTATPATIRQTLKFDVPLGSIQTETYKFRVFNSTKCEYACKVTKPDTFTVVKSLSVDAVSGGWSGDEVSIDVAFEPTEIGETIDTLSISSPDGGEYICELVAICVAPVPQGPFNFTQGAGATDIAFRNCFSTACSWTFSLDSSAFRLGAPNATVQPKTEGKCQIFFEPKDEHGTSPGTVVTAKLFIQCSAKPDLSPWVFYLKGTITGTSDAGTKKK